MTQQEINAEIIKDFLDQLSDEAKSEIKDMNYIVNGLSQWHILKAGNNQMILDNKFHESTLQIIDGQLKIDIKEKDKPKVIPNIANN